MLLEGIAALVREKHPDLEIRVVEGGGVMNHALVGSGQLPMAICNPPMTVAALQGGAPFPQAFPALRIGVANLTVNYLHCVVERDLPVQTLEDWLQQRYPLRLPVDRVGTVDRMTFALMLEYFGVTEADLAAWGGGILEAESYEAQVILYGQGAVQGIWQFMGLPSPSIQQAQAVRPLKILPLPEGLITHLTSLGWTAADLPAGAYGFVTHPVPSVAMGTSLGFHAEVPEEIVLAITQTLCEFPERVQAIHPAAGTFVPARAPQQAGGPLHPGAERYYRQRGMLP